MKAALGALLLSATLTAQTGPISGKWHLLQNSDDEINLPSHRVDLIFRAGAGAIINRNTGEDIPLANLKFDGNTLTLQIADAAPILTMTAKGDRFEGHWMKGTTEIGPMVKLVRFR